MPFMYCHCYARTPYPVNIAQKSSICVESCNSKQVVSILTSSQAPVLHHWAAAVSSATVWLGHQERGPSKNSGCKQRKTEIVVVVVRLLAGNGNKVTCNGCFPSYNLDRTPNFPRTPIPPIFLISVFKFHVLFVKFLKHFGIIYLLSINPSNSFPHVCFV